MHASNYDAQPFAEYNLKIKVLMSFTLASRQVTVKPSKTLDIFSRYYVYFVDIVDIIEIALCNILGIMPISFFVLKLAQTHN